MQAEILQAMNNDILIFILDDDEMEAQELGFWLKENGYPNYKIFTVSKQLLENIDTNGRIFIIDYRLDMYNGLEVIDKIKQVVPHCYFIMLSGMKDYSIVERFCNSVVRGRYVTKGEPDTNDKIIRFIKEFVEDIQLMETFYKSKEEIVNSIKEVKKIMKGDI
jgi:FixJ family two-component response regulator